jgi:hypothetical protein
MQRFELSKGIIRLNYIDDNFSSILQLRLGRYRTRLFLANVWSADFDAVLIPVLILTAKIPQRPVFA